MSDKLHIKGQYCAGQNCDCGYNDNCQECGLPHGEDISCEEYRRGCYEDQVYDEMSDK